MAACTMTRRLNKTLTIINFTALGVLIIASLFFVDSNGRICGLGEEISNVITIALFCVGILSSTTLAISDKRHRIRAVVFLVVYLILAAPAILPL